MTRVELTIALDDAEGDARLAQVTGFAHQFYGRLNTEYTTDTVLAYDFADDSQARQFGGLLNQAGTVSVIAYIPA